MAKSKLGGEDLLAMEGSNHHHHHHTTPPSCTKNKGCFVGRGVGVLLGVVFVSGLVATGLLVYYYAPHESRLQEESLLVPRAQVCVCVCVWWR